MSNYDYHIDKAPDAPICTCPWHDGTKEPHRVGAKGCPLYITYVHDDLESLNGTITDEYVHHQNGELSRVSIGNISYANLPMYLNDKCVTPLGYANIYCVNDNNKVLEDLVYTIEYESKVYLLNRKVVKATGRYDKILRTDDTGAFLFFNKVIERENNDVLGILSTKYHLDFGLMSDEESFMYKDDYLYELEKYFDCSLRDYFFTFCNIDVRSNKKRQEVLTLQNYINSHIVNMEGIMNVYYKHVANPGNTINLWNLRYENSEYMGDYCEEHKSIDFDKMKAENGMTEKAFLDMYFSDEKANRELLREITLNNYTYYD